MAENLHGIAHENVSEALRKHLGVDFLHGNMFFLTKQLKCIAKGGRDPLEQPLLRLFIGKRRGGCRLVELSSPGRAGRQPPPHFFYK